VLDALFIQLTGNGIDPCWDLCTGTDFIKTYKNICIFTSFSIFFYIILILLSLPLKRIPSRLEQLQTLLFHLQKIIY
jgi:hypothetical protein